MNSTYAKNGEIKSSSDLGKGGSFRESRVNGTGQFFTPIFAAGKSMNMTITMNAAPSAKGIRRLTAYQRMR